MPNIYSVSCMYFAHCSLINRYRFAAHQAIFQYVYRPKSSIRLTPVSVAACPFFYYSQRRQPPWPPCSCNLWSFPVPWWLHLPPYLDPMSRLHSRLRGGSSPPHTSKPLMLFMTYLHHVNLEAWLILHTRTTYNITQLLIKSILQNALISGCHHTYKYLR